MYNTSVIKNMCEILVLKIFQTKIMKNQETVYLKWREIVFEKRVFHLYKRAPLFDKAALG